MGSHGLALEISLTLAALLAAGVGSPSALACLPGPLDPRWTGHLAQEGKQPSKEEVEALLTSGGIHLPIALWPSRGPAPLRVGVLWTFFGPPGPLQAIEIDADGDGRPEVVDTREENLGYLYARPGEYPATVTVREKSGKSTTYRRPVTVLTPEAFEAEMQGYWRTFRSALKRGDLAGAQECIHSLRRQNMESTLRDLIRSDVERELPPIRLLEFQVIQATYESLQPPPGQQRPLTVRFRLDMDGVWRIADFEPKVNP